MDCPAPSQSSTPSTRSGSQKACAHCLAKNARCSKGKVAKTRRGPDQRFVIGSKKEKEKKGERDDVCKQAVCHDQTGRTEHDITVEKVEMQDYRMVARSSE